MKPGFYGKLPTTGDFISRSLPREFIDFWDQWLQVALESSRNTLGDEWLQFYLVSPVWRFVLSPGTCQENAWAGVMVPSVDSVGRYFPMTIAVPLSPELNLLDHCTVYAEWYEKAEKILLDMLSSDEFNIDEYTNDVNLLGVPGQKTEGFYLSGNIGALNCARYPLDKIENLQSLFTGILGRYVQDQYSSYSLWWTQGSQDIKPVFMISDGMPPGGGYSDMITGKWDTDVWQDMTLPISDDG